MGPNRYDKCPHCEETMRRDYLKRHQGLCKSRQVQKKLVGVNGMNKTVGRKIRRQRVRSQSPSIVREGSITPVSVGYSSDNKMTPSTEGLSRLETMSFGVDGSSKERSRGDDTLSVRLRRMQFNVS